MKRFDKTVLTIAGSDSCAGAGIQADLRTFEALGVVGVTAITAITAQNSERFFSVNAVPPRVLREQLHAIQSRLSVDAIKIGMLGTEDNTYSVVRFLERYPCPFVVLDPVFKSSTDMILLNPRGIAILRQFLLDHCFLVTPNLSEASLLTDVPVTDVSSMKKAARTLVKSHPGLKAALVTGGHLPGTPVDILYDGGNFFEFEKGPRFPRDVHGTGCVYSSAITAYLATGCSLVSSVEKAKSYITKYISERQETGIPQVHQV